MSVNAKIKMALGVVRRLSGQTELPVRSEYELTKTLQCLFTKTQEEAEK